jgi:hypothetical protein
VNATIAALTGFAELPRPSVEASKRRLQIAERANRAQIQTQPDDCLRDLRPDADENRLTAQQACGLDHL